jgi:hypothetical protein
MKWMNSLKYKSKYTKNTECKAEKQKIYSFMSIKAIVKHTKKIQAQMSFTNELNQTFKGKTVPI